MAGRSHVSTSTDRGVSDRIRADRVIVRRADAILSRSGLSIDRWAIVAVEHSSGIGFVVGERSCPRTPSTCSASSLTFPGRLGGVADWLVRRRGYRCHFFCHRRRPKEFWPASAGRGMDVVAFNVGGVAREATVAWQRSLERSLCYSFGCWEVLEQRRPRPIDVVLGRSDGLGSSLFAPVHVPRTPVVQFFDYYYHARKHDLADEAGPETPAGLLPLATGGQRDRPPRPGERRRPLGPDRLAA